MWITTKDFECLKPIYVYKKQLIDKKIESSTFFNYHVHFVRNFNAEAMAQYRIRISADDYYKLYINGQFIGQGPAPAYTQHYNYNEFDISPFVHKGENRIAVHVYYQGEINRVWNSGDNRMGLWVQLFKNGSMFLESDESWQYKRAEEFSGTTTGYETQYLENIDFAKKDTAWKMADASAERFISAVPVPNPDWQFEAEAATPLAVYTTTPQIVQKLAEGTYLMDFGTEITGQVYFKARGKKGQKVILKHAEELNEDGSIRYEMRCNCTYYEECTLSGNVDEFEFFDYKAFRYAQVECDTDVFFTDTFSAIVRHAPFNARATLETDIPHLADIFKICQNSIKYGVQESYLDCPSREKGQYLGDFTVTGLSHLCLTGNAKMYRKALFDFARTAFICDGILAVAPGSYMQEIADFSLQYPLQVLNYYNLTQDTDTVRALYPTIEGILKYFAAFERTDGLLENITEKWNLVDWPQNLRDNYAVNTVQKPENVPLHNVINAFYICAHQCAEKLTEAIGVKKEKKSDALIRTYTDAFYCKKTKLFYDTPQKTHAALHSNALPLCFGIAPTEAQESIKDFILEKGLVCGVQFSFFVLKALIKVGAFNEALSMILNESSQGWVNMLREDATTCFEAWGKEQKWNTSLCHPWASAPIAILLQDIMQIPPHTLLRGSGIFEKHLPQGKIKITIV